MALLSPILAIFSSAFAPVLELSYELQKTPSTDSIKADKSYSIVATLPVWGGGTVYKCARHISLHFTCGTLKKHKRSRLSLPIHGLSRFSQVLKMLFTTTLIAAEPAGRAMHANRSENSCFSSSQPKHSFVSLYVQPASIHVQSLLAATSSFSC